MNKIAKLIPLFLAAAISLTGCVGVPEGFDETEVKEKAKEVVELLNNRDFHAVTAMTREDLQELLPADELEKALIQQLSDLGAFVEYKSVMAAGTKDQKTQEDYAVVVVTAVYQNGNATYTISVDRDLAVVGLYMK